MDEQRYRFGVGVLVVASLIIGIILILFFGAAPNFFARRYTVTINFPAAPGVETDTPVRKNGVQIGRVTHVELLQVEVGKPDPGVNLTLELDSDVKIRRSEVARIGTGSLITGDAVIEFVQGNDQNRVGRFDGMAGSPRDGMLDTNEQQLANSFLENEEYAGPGSGQVAPDPLAALMTMQENVGSTLNTIARAGTAVEQAGTSIAQAGNQVNELAADLRKVIGGGGGEFQKIGQRVEQTFDNLNETLDSIQAFADNPDIKLAIKTTSERLPLVIKQAEEVMAQTKSTLASFEKVGKAAEQTMQNVAEFTEPLGEQGERLVTDVTRMLGNLDALVADLRQFSSKVNNSNGTLKLLVEDPQMYYTIVRTLENVEGVTRRLQPVIEDARVFTDKISRDPSQLGVRGALQARPVGLGVK